MSEPLGKMVLKNWEAKGYQILNVRTENSIPYMVNGKERCDGEKMPCIFGVWDNVTGKFKSTKKMYGVNKWESRDFNGKVNYDHNGFGLRLGEQADGLVLGVLDFDNFGSDMCKQYCDQFYEMCEDGNGWFKTSTIGNQGVLFDYSKCPMLIKRLNGKIVCDGLEIMNSKGCQQVMPPTMTTCKREKKKVQAREWHCDQPIKYFQEGDKFEGWLIGMLDKYQEHKVSPKKKEKVQNENAIITSEDERKNLTDDQKMWIDALEHLDINGLAGKGYGWKMISALKKQGIKYDDVKHWADKSKGWDWQQKWSEISSIECNAGFLVNIMKKENPDGFEKWHEKHNLFNRVELCDWYTQKNNSTEGANSELLFETEYDIANDLFAKLKERIVYTRKQVFFKHNNIWVYDSEIIKDVLLGYIMKQPYFYSSEFYEKKTKQIIQVKGKPANKSLKSGESLMALLMTIVRQHSDDTFYNKFIDTTKHKIAFNDGVLDIQKKTFTTWDLVTNFYSPIKINRNFQNVFDNQDKYKTASDDIKRRIISTLFGDKTESALNFFSRGLAGCYEDKNWSMFMGNRNSGKGVLDLLTKNALGNYYSSFDANNLLYERSSGEDKAKKMYWLLDLQFIRITISQEVKTDVKSNLKIDGVTVKSMASGGDTLKARRNYDVYMKEFVITSAIMMMFNDMPAVEPADALETCYQFTSVSQFKSQEEIDDMNNQNCDPLMMKKYLVKDETIKDKCKSVEWSDAYILLLMDSFKEKPTPHNRVIDDADNTDLTFKIFESFKFDDNDSFVSFNEIKKWIDFEGINATLKKVKTELLGLGVKEHKCVGVRGYKGAFLKPTSGGIGEDDATTEY